MIICDRNKANELLGDSSNLFKDDERNKDIISIYLESINYETQEIKRGRGDGVLNLDDEKRKEIATLALTSGLTTDEVALMTGSSRDAINAYKHGATSEATYNKPNVELKEHVDDIKVQITGAAQNKLMEAIEALTGQKINSSKARDISGIAKDMSQVMRNMNPEGNSGPSQNVKVMIYQPRMKEESDFNVISVNE